MQSYSVRLSAKQKKQIKIAQCQWKILRKRERISDDEIFRGRCEYVDSSSLYVTSKNRTVLFFLEGKSTDIRVGDLVTIFYRRKKKGFSLMGYKIDQHPLLSPVGQKGSPFYKLHAGTSLFSVLETRSLFFRGVRDFFDGDGFLELQTPTLVESPGVEKYLEVFSTEYEDALGKRSIFYLPTSPEFSLKEALSSGLDKIYEVAKCFRNHGENSDLHRPEFFMLEWYRIYEDESAIIKDCAALLLYLCRLLHGQEKKEIIFQNERISLDCYDIVTVKELFAKLGIELDDYTSNPERFVRHATELLFCSSEGLTKEDLFFKIMLDKIEPFLGRKRPVFLTEYPIEMTPLSLRSEKNPLYGRRFELYLCAMELANGYNELTDTEEQKKRFSLVLEERKNAGGSPLPFPARFLTNMSYGIPPCSGVALGLERLFMILMGINKIDNTILLDVIPSRPD